MLDKANLLFSVFTNSQFKYASVIWMFCRETHYEKIQKIQHNVLKIVFSSHESYAKLEIDNIQNNDDTTHQKHLRNTGYGNLYSYYKQ